MVKVWGFAANVVLTLSNRTHGESFAASRSFCHRAEFFCRQKELSHCSSVCRLFLSGSGKMRCGLENPGFKMHFIYNIAICIDIVLLQGPLLYWCTANFLFLFEQFLYVCKCSAGNVENHFFLVHHQRMQVNLKKKSCRVTLCKWLDSGLQNPLGVSRQGVWIRNICAGRVCSAVLQRDCSRAQSKNQFKRSHDMGGFLHTMSHYKICA